DVASLLTCFNIDLFPNSSDVQPVMAYEKKSQVLNFFEDRPDSFKRLQPILKDVLVLHDTIRREFREKWNAEEGGPAGKLAFVEDKKRGEFEFPFTGKTSKYRLMNGALYPILAAFRWMVEDDPRTGNVRWRGGFKRVLSLWEESGIELMRMTVTANNELGRNP